ncbi:MAG: sn-glycerol-3-phosphate ABC transporter ATP-binding protein UgpC [Clostridia bacterium]|nr:sn-glycerol-3-phosphate ABC transporter ATP-binding protein UgpC [Clostridia bacterium]
MASLKLNHIYKVYPNGAKAVNDFCMDIEDKEFIVFVGPSGCGKSTTLRMIAGLEEITAGELMIGDSVVNDVEPMHRDIAMVFQNYALYPHMTVYENMAFGLKLRKMPKEEVDRRVNEAAEILGITEYLQRKPAAMSGGQRQRVALGRAIVREPKVFLLDEPLSNLDAKLRNTMRSEISKLHNKLQTTFVYVTHDQVEAMTMGTRIVVMKDGFVQQIDTPRNLYRYPVNKFVAGFIGTPQMNFYTGKLKAEGDNVRVTFDNTEVNMLAPAEYFAKADVRYLNGEKPVVFGIRLEHVSVDPEKYPYKAKCRVSYVEDLGVDGQVYADFDLNSEDTITESATKVIIKAPENAFYRAGEIIDVSMDLSHLHLFDAETEKTIAPRIPEEAIVYGTVKGGKLSVLGTQLVLPSAISAADGEYEIHIPTAALSFGGNIKAEFVKEEDVNGQRLVQMNAGGKMLFMYADQSSVLTKGVAVDLKQCSFVMDGAEAVSPLPAENELSGKILISKQKKEITAENGAVKKVKQKVYSLEISGKSFVCPEAVGEKIVNCGKKIFNGVLAVRFSPYCVNCGAEGIPAHVTNILDYGNEKFAECTVREITAPRTDKKKKSAEEAEAFIERKIYVAVGSGFNDTEVTLVPELEKVKIYGREQDIRII